MPIANPDIGFHLKTGELIFQRGVVSCCDEFSFTVYGRPFVHSHWLSQLIFYSLSFYFGNNALVWLKVGLVFLTFFYVCKTLLLFTNMDLLSAVLAFSLAYASRFFYELLPLLFTSFFLSFTLYILFSFKKNGTKIVFWLPLLFFIWANCHPGFMSGIFALLLFLAGEFLNFFFKKEACLSRNNFRMLFFLSMAAIAATLVNPDFYALWLYPFSLPFKKTEYAFFVKTWQPSLFYAEELYLYVLLAAAYIFSVIVLWRARRLAWTEALIAFIFFIFSLTAVRHIPLFCIACTPFLGCVCAWLAKDRNARVLLQERKILFAFLCAGILMSVYTAFSLRHRANLPALIRETYLPHDAVAFLKANALYGNTFNDYDTGGYLIWKLSPEVKVFMDGRADLLYPEAHFKLYRRIMGLEPGWEYDFKKFSFSFFLLRNESPLAHTLYHNSSYVSVYQDYFYSIFISRDDYGRRHGKLKYAKGSYYYFQQGNMFFLKEDYVNALENYRKALRKTPDIPVLYYNLGITYIKLGDVRGAKACFRRALRINPGYDTARKNMSALGG